MRKLKIKLLFSLASEVDFSKKSQKYKYGSYNFLYFRLSEYRKGSVRDATVRLVRSGAVDRLIRNKKARFRLTSIGREMLLERLGVKGQVKTWDRAWRVVMINRVEGMLRQLQKELNGLGYKRVSRGVYLTPLSVSEETKRLFRQKKWLNKAQVIESRRVLVGDDLQLARSLWKLDKQADEYSDFVNIANRLLKMARRNLTLLQQSKNGFKEVFDRYFGLWLQDPGLPKQLLPPEWQADKAKELFLRLVELTKTAKI